MAKMKISVKSSRLNLLSWYKKVFRPLPWRMDRDPYKIWISEVMLQQTTVQAVLPYYERFLKKFPTLESLSQATIEDVYDQWAGLGYYSRARNLHKSAQLLQQRGFAETADELIEFPGFGPYTSRAVASLAFGEQVGVLDGNVIRVLCRFYGLKLEWWKTAERIQLQKRADELAQTVDSHLVNQALMELGATVCTPKSPNCPTCPWQKSCVAYAQKITATLPLAKPKEKFEHWIWQPHLIYKNKKFVLIQNETAPFLKSHWIFPGQFEKLKAKPQEYDLRHSITKYNIYVRLNKKMETKMQHAQTKKWVSPDELKKVNPSSLLQKVLSWARKSGQLPMTLIFFFLMACQQKSVLPNQLTIQGPDAILGIGARPLTFLGQNHSPKFNSDGDRLLFVSRNRPQHKNNQVYELNFQKLSERRVTFQDGDVFSPHFLRADEIIYSSTTDEIKESLISREDLAQNQNRLEIYSSDLFGNEITRWTKSPGLDTEPSTQLKNKNKHNFVYFLSESRKPAGIYALNGPMEAAQLIHAQSKNSILRPEVSPLGPELIWIEKESENKTQVLRLKSTPKSNVEDILTTRGDWQNVSWGPEPDQWLLSEKPLGSDDYRIILYDSKNQCTQVLISSPGQSLLDPAVNQNTPRLLVFTIRKGENSQIYSMEWPKDRGPCLEQQKQAKLKE